MKRLRIYSSMVLVLGILFFTPVASGQLSRQEGDTTGLDRQLQSLSLRQQEDLVVLGKVWGFIKYFHPKVAGGKEDWDKALIDFLPRYLQALTKKQRSDLLLAWIDGLGTVPKQLAGSYQQVKDHIIKPDLSWISDKGFQKKIKARLLEILANRHQGDQYYIKFFRTEGLNIPVFQNEKLYPQPGCPPAAIRLLALYRLWNVIEYWYPYKYNLKVPWKDALLLHLPVFIGATTPGDYVMAIKRVLVAIQDGHAYLASSANTALMGNYYMPVRFKYVQDRVIIGSISNDSVASAAGLRVGDIIESINGVRVLDILDQKLQITPGSNQAYQLYAICLNLNRTLQSSAVLEVSTGSESRTVRVPNELIKKSVDQYISTFSYQKDSALSLLRNDIAYLNMGKLTMKQDSAAIVALINKSAALVVDARQNAIEDPNRENVIPLVEEWIGNGTQPYIFSTGQPEFPGVFKFAQDTSRAFNPHPVKYQKPVVILINEESISVGEFMAMLFSQAPQSVLMGSRTAGADGPASRFVLPGNTYIGFTGTGIYWKDGRETQRVGITPQIEVRPTIEGYRNNEDEVLERAIEYLSKQLK